MSRVSNFENASVTNPCTLNLTWSNTDRTFKIYNRDTKSTSLARLPLRFVVIDTFIKITGWDEKNECSYYSNEIKDTRSEKLIVKTKNGTVGAGLYADIKTALNEGGAKYSESVYIMLEDGSLANVTLVGSNSQAWMQFKKENMRFFGTSYLGVGNPQAHKKGSVTWHTPEFKMLEPITDTHMTRADELYNELQNYKSKQILQEKTHQPEVTITDAKAILAAIINDDSDGIGDDDDCDIPNDLGF